MKYYKKWTKLFLIFVTMTLFTVILFNYFVDSTGLFNNKKYIELAAKKLVKGQIIAGLKNYDDRLFQEYIISNNKNKIDFIVIGSSRSMMIRSKMFTSENNFFNHSVSGASLEDYISIIGLYKTIKNHIPQRIILGIDPWIFNKNNGQNRWKSLYSYYYNFNNMINNNEKEKYNNVYFSKWKQLVNYEYTVSNIKYFYEGKKDFFYQPTSINIDDTIKDIDGSIYYPYSIRYLKNNKEVKNKAISFTKGNNTYSLNNFTKINNIKLFENLITYLQNNNIEVIFFLPSYHPISYDFIVLDDRYKNINNVEKYVRGYAKINNIKLYGSYNPHKFNLTNNDFFDGMHGMERMFLNIFPINKNIIY